MNSNKIILLVEDNPDHITLTLRALKKNEITTRVVVVRDGAEALDYLFGTGAFEGRDTNIQPEVILLDINLPKISGTEVLKQLRSDPRTALIPVAMLTTSTEESDIRASYEHHANSYIHKPVEFEQFSEMVRQLGEYWLSLNVSPPTVA